MALLRTGFIPILFLSGCSLFLPGTLSYEGMLTWESANEVCAKKALRLPNRKELETLARRSPEQFSGGMGAWTMERCISADGLGGVFQMSPAGEIRCEDRYDGRVLAARCLK